MEHTSTWLLADTEDDENLSLFEFERFEDKFLLPLSRKKEFLKLVEKYMEPSYLIEGTTFNIIESVYFDSEKFDFYYDHIFQSPLRHKLRLRRYGRDGLFKDDDSYLIEVKTKKPAGDGVRFKTRKHRIYLSNEQFNDLYTGNLLMLDDESRSLNRIISERQLQKTIKKVNKILSRFHPVPTAIVSYERKAYEKDDFRVTCDDALRFESLQAPEICVQNEYTNKLNDKFTLNPSVIIELKHAGQIPAWIQEYFASLEIVDTGFSKYCYAISQHVRHSKQMTN